MDFAPFASSRLALSPSGSVAVRGRGSRTRTGPWLAIALAAVTAISFGARAAPSTGGRTAVAADPVVAASAASAAPTLEYVSHATGATRSVLVLRSAGAGVEVVNRADHSVVARADMGRGPVVVHGSAVDDTLVVDFSGGDPVPAGGLVFDGGAQLTARGDLVVVRGGRFDRGVVDYASRSDGVIRLDGNRITYRGLEPVDMTGSTVNDLVFNLPGTADDAILEDDGTAANNTSRLRSGNATFETTVFTNPSGSLTVNAGSGDNVTINPTDSFGAANVTVATPDTALLGSLQTTGVLSLTVAHSINQTGAIFVGRLAAVAGTGVVLTNAGNSIGSIESETNTGGIAVNTAGAVAIGNVSAGLTGLKVETSGDISVHSGGTLSLVDTDGLESVTGGSVSGNVALTATGGNIVRTTDIDAVTVSRGTATLTAGLDILMGTSGFDDDNDIRASGSVTLDAGRDITIDGFSDVASDDFGQNTGGALTLDAARNVNITNNAGDDASAGASGNAGADVLVTTGPNDALTLTAPSSAALFSSSGDVTATSDRAAIGAASGITATGHVVTLQQNSANWNVHLGPATDTTASTLELSDAELDRAFASTLRIGKLPNNGSIEVSAPISAGTSYGTLTLRTSDAVIDSNASEPDISVTNLAFRTGNGANADTHVSTLAGVNGAGTVDIANSGGLTIATVDSVAGVTNTGTLLAIGASSPITVAADVVGAGSVTLNAADSAGAGDDVILAPGVTVESTAGGVSVSAGDNVTIPATSEVKADSGSVVMFVDASNIDPGVGGVFTLRGLVSGSSTTVTGDTDGDRFLFSPGGAVTGLTVAGQAGADVYRFDAGGAVTAALTESGGCAGPDALQFPNLPTGITLDLGSTGSQAVSAGVTLTLSTADGFENVTGTNQVDNVTGNSCGNFVLLQSGGDTGNGLGGSDELRGKRGADSLTGGSGTDLLKGGFGGDTLNAVDGAGGDTVNGNVGFDTCTFDPGDTVTHCEA